MMLLKKQAVVAFVSILSLPSVMVAQPDIPAAIQDTIAQMEQDLAMPVGAAAAIIYQGKVLYFKTFGHEYEGGPAITSDTYFSLGSSTKPLAAMVVSDLMDKGEVTLDSPLGKAIPYLAKGVELQHILSHTTGYTYKGNQDIEKGLKRPELLTKLFKSKVDAKPGLKFLYNNLTYSLLENVVENSTGKTWTTAFKEGLAKRGLEHVAIIVPPTDAPVAHPHYYNEEKDTLTDLGRFRKNYPKEVSFAAGGYASLNDLIKFAKLQLTGEFDHLHQPVIEAKDVFYWGGGKAFPPPSKLQSSYGLGWRIFQLKGDKENDTRLVFHSGWIKGVSAFVGFMKKHDLAIVAIANDDRGIPQRFGFRLWKNVAKVDH